MNAKMQQLHPHRERVYVKVTSDFDTTGYMRPKSITWDDGRVFQIDSVTDFRPVTAMISDKAMPTISGNISTSDCYTVVIHGKERHLYFERTDPLFASCIGRWFVERTAV